MTAVGRALLVLLFFLIFFASPVRAANLLEIPILNLKEEIIPINPFSFKSYMPVIENHVARATGTSDKLTYLFTHSDRGRAIFSNLDFLAEHDLIYLNSKTYYVTNKEIVAATNLSPLLQKPTEETVVLQTCLTNAGLSQRLIVTAKPAVYLTRNLRPLKN